MDFGVEFCAHLPALNHAPVDFFLALGAGQVVKEIVRGGNPDRHDGQGNNPPKPAVAGLIQGHPFSFHPIFLIAFASTFCLLKLAVSISISTVPPIP
jgi:hypothetical protein